MFQRYICNGSTDLGTCNHYPSECLPELVKGLEVPTRFEKDYLCFCIKGPKRVVTNNRPNHRKYDRVRYDEEELVDEEELADGFY